jgi:hypothetical protein
VTSVGGAFHLTSSEPRSSDRRQAESRLMTVADLRTTAPRPHVPDGYWNSVFVWVVRWSKPVSWTLRNAR